MKRNGDRGGFTLIELLIVVVVIATMMGILFRLAGVGSNQKARNLTITRIQKLEFALSGYYAAFGSYPPVPLHGSRDIFCGVNEYGIQYTGNKDSEKTLSWNRVRAACLSQPVAVEYPPNSKASGFNSDLSAFRESAVSSLKSLTALEDGDKGSFPNKQRLAKLDGTLWQKEQLFKFGVLSFLLPRYLFMLDGPEWMYDNADYSVQWNSANDLRTIFNFKNGRQLYATANSRASGSAGTGWAGLREDTQQGQSTQSSRYDEKAGYHRILAQPSQAVCARWMQGLQGIIDVSEVQMPEEKVFFGVDVMRDDRMVRGQPTDEIEYNEYLPCYRASTGGPNGNSGGKTYWLDSMTITDGWDEDIFYYSPPPYQGYRVWSAGPNHKTIPPWVDFESSDMKAFRTTAADWIRDDIVGLSTPSN